MGYFGKKNKGEKIFRGAYSYLRNKNIYSEENFEVFRDKKEMTFLFASELVSRVSTGELLTINVDYTINKEYIPQKVVIDRKLGERKILEVWMFDSQRTRINYTFINEDGEVDIEVSTQPKFSIATPALAPSMLFLRSKKFDATSNNFFSIVGSRNLWTYENPPQANNVMVTKVHTSSENIKIDGNALTANQYKIEDESNFEDETPGPALKAWLSQYMTIPYIVESSDGTKIQIKYLNNLDKEQ